MGYFDIKRENELIAAGTHFFCLGCLVAVPLDDQGGDSRYCQHCFDALRAEAEMQPTRKAAWMPRVADTGRKAPQVAPAGEEVVAKLVQHGLPPTTKKQAIMQQPGRPRKEGEVSRATRWRRAKQGVLL